jgi:hypothetical protein
MVVQEMLQNAGIKDARFVSVKRIGTTTKRVRNEKV